LARAKSEPFVVAGEEGVPAGEEQQRGLERIEAAEADCRVEDGDAGVDELLVLRVGEALGVHLPRCLQREVEREGREHVDDRRALHERDRARRVLDSRAGGEPAAAAVDHGGAQRRRGHQRGTGGSRALQQRAAGK
jgi:hypothetical protein